MLKRVILLLLLTTVIFNFLSAQQHDKIWIFGRNAGLDFNTLPPTSFFFDTNNPPFMNGSYEADANVCDENGRLLFYTNGTHMYDRQENIMANGNNILPLTNMTISHTGSSSQGCIIVPFPNDNSKYYVFSLTCQEMGPDAGKLYYSVVDMTLNNGLGDVVAGQKGIFLGDGYTEHMSAIAGKCGTFRLILISYNTHFFTAYKIDTNGIDINPVISNTFSASPSFNGVGTITPNPTEDKIAVTRHTITNSTGGLYLYDIDRFTGEVTNEVVLDTLSCYGCCFSDDGSKLYFADGSRLYQMDLNAGSIANIRASKTVLMTGTISYTYTDLKLGLDNKIYLKGSAAGGSLLATINFPNLSGLSCQPQDNSVQLQTGSGMRLGLPNVVPEHKFADDTVTTSQPVTICRGATNELTPNIQTGKSYKWENGSSQIIRSIDSAGVYWISYIKDCTYYIDSFVVSFFPNDNNQTELIDSICSYESYHFNGKNITAPGKYVDSFINIYGCDSLSILHLSHKVNPRVDFDFFLSDDICIKDSIDATAKNARTYQWYINNEFYDSVISIRFPLDLVVTEVKLVGISENGCSNAVTKNIEVNICCDMFIPNAFSPNGDGVNDMFAPINYGKIQSYQFKIFNRFGEQVFSTDNMNASWDGRVKNAAAETGVYFYYVKGKCIDGSDFINKGDVTLLR